MHGVLQAQAGIEAANVPTGALAPNHCVQWSSRPPAKPAVHERQHRGAPAAAPTAAAADQRGFLARNFAALSRVGAGREPGTDVALQIASMVFIQRNSWLAGPRILAATLALSGCAAHTEPTPAGPVRPAPAPLASLRPDASIQELMQSEVDPSADHIWDAVETVVSSRGTEERHPRTEAQWADLRRSAITLIEATNLLQMDGRRVSTKPFAAEADGALDSTQIQQRLDSNRAGFNAFAQSCVPPYCGSWRPLTRRIRSRWYALAATSMRSVRRAILRSGIRTRSFRPCPITFPRCHRSSRARADSASRVRGIQHAGHAVVPRAAA